MTRENEIAVNQGGVSLIPISANLNMNSLHAQLGTNKIPIVKRNDSLFVLVSVDLEMKQGNYMLRLYSNKKIMDSYVVKVRKVSFPRTVYDRNFLDSTAKADPVSQMLWARYIDKLSTTSSTEYATIKKLGNPLSNVFTTSVFGKWRIFKDKRYPHRGVDLRAALGTQLFAVGDGKIVWSENDILPGNGITIVLDLGGGIRIFYLHLSKVVVKTGDIVEKGQVIGFSGSTGTLEPHLHLGVRCRSAKVDPMTFLQVFRE